jgi:dimethylaniline monooxygenase (N-oxide forming)
MTFDFVIICCGRFGDVARLPSFPESHGPEVFSGRVLHALDYSALDSKGTQELVRGKKVVVVGFQKTSLDVAEINKGEQIISSKLVG